MADLEKLGKVSKKAVTALKCDVSEFFDAVNDSIGDIKEYSEEAVLFNF